MSAYLRVSPSLRLMDLASENFPTIPVKSRLLSCREVRKIEIEKTGVSPDWNWYVLLPNWVYTGLSFAETLSRLRLNVPCVEKVPLSLLMRWMKMWMWLVAVPRFIVIWNLGGSPSENPWAMLSWKTSGLLAFLFEFFISLLHSALAFFGRFYMLITM